MSEETLNYLDQLVRKEVEFEITSTVLMGIFIALLVIFAVYTMIQDRKTKRFREQWRDSLTKEQKQAINEERKLKL